MGMGFCNNCMWCRKKPQGVIISLKIFLQAHTYHTTVTPTNHPAFCLIIKQKYCLSQPNPLFFVLTCDAIHFEWTHIIFKQKYSKSRKFDTSQAKVYLQVGRYVITKMYTSTVTVLVYILVMLGHPSLTVTMCVCGVHVRKNDLCSGPLNVLR